MTRANVREAADRVTAVLNRHPEWRSKLTRTQIGYLFSLSLGGKGVNHIEGAGQKLINTKENET